MDLPVLVELLKEVNLGQFLAIAALFWFFYSRIDKKFEKIDQRFEKIDQRFEKIDQRFADLEHKMNERFEKVDQRFIALEHKMDQRLAKLEFDMVEVKTILRLKECCMIQDERHMKKAE